MEKPVILYFFVGKSTFVSKDVSILSKKFTVRTFNFSPGAKWKTPLQFLQQFVFLLLNSFSSKATFIQLGGYHSLLPVVFGKVTGRKSFIVAAGTDCVSFPKTGYGNFSRSLLGWCTAFSFRHCSHIIPKHETLWSCKYSYDDDGSPEQGISRFVPGITTPYTVIVNGYEANEYVCNDKPEAISFITASGAMHYPFQQRLKGIDLFVGAARNFPQYKFTVVGITDEVEIDRTLPNLRLITPLHHEELKKEFCAHTFYMQLSLAEGFPNALCEAMLSGCVPIGSAVFSIPEIIGDTGLILSKRNQDDLNSLINAAVKSDISGRSVAARKRIAENYTLKLREEKLLELMESRIHLTT